MGNFQSQNTSLEVNQEIVAGCSQSVVTRAIARASDINITNACGDINIGNVEQTVSIPTQNCAIDVSVENITRATQELQQRLENIPLGSNIGVQEMSQSLNQRLRAYCDQNVNVEAVADVQRVNISRQQECTPAVRSAINIANVASQVQGGNATQCVIGAAAKTVSDLRNSASQVNKGWNPTAFLDNMTQGIQILLILAGVAAVLGAITMIVVKARKKPEEECKEGEPCPKTKAKAKAKATPKTTTSPSLKEVASNVVESVKVNAPSVAETIQKVATSLTTAGGK